MKDPEFYLWADENGDAKMSHNPPTSDEDGKIMNLEELGKLMRNGLVKIREHGRIGFERVTSSYVLEVE